MIQSGKDIIDLFLFERSLFVVVNALPNLVGLCGIYGEYRHFAYLFQALASVKHVVLAYLTVRILLHSTCKKLWKQKLMVILFAMTCVVISVVGPFGVYFTLKLLIGIPTFTVVIYYHGRYLLSLPKHEHGWKENVVKYISVGNVYELLSFMIRFSIFGSIHDHHKTAIYAYVLANRLVFWVLACILETIPRAKFSHGKSSKCFP